MGENDTVTQTNPQNQYLALLRRTAEQERKYTDIENTINQEIIRLLTQEHQEVCVEKDVLREKIEELSAQQSQKEVVTEELAAKEAALHLKEREAKDVHAQKKALEKQLKKTEDDHRKSEKKKEEALTLAAAKEKELDEIRKSQKEMQETLQSAKSALQKKEDEAQVLARAKEEAAQQASSLKIEVLEREKEIERIKQCMEKKEKEAQQLQEKITQGNRAVSQEAQKKLERRIEELEEEVRKHPLDVQKAREECTQFRIEKEISKAKVEEKDKTIVILQNTISRFEDLLSKQMQFSIEKAYSAHVLPEAFNVIAERLQGPRVSPVIPERAGAVQSLPPPSVQREVDGPLHIQEEIPKIKQKLPNGVVREPVQPKKESGHEHRKTKTERSENAEQGAMDSEEVLGLFDARRRSSKKRSGAPAPRQIDSSSTVTAPKKESGRGKRKGQVMDFNQEMAKKPAASQNHGQALVETKKKDFSTLFGKNKEKAVFSARPEASSFFANLSFSDYEVDNRDKN